MIDVILKYFPTLSDTQKQQFAELGVLYPDWNSKINVISRKDIDNLYVNHILHSLAIAKFIDFKAGSSVIDMGTGGGFPGVPLAVMFPEVKFHLVDRIGKKLKVVDDIASKIGLKNVTTQHGGGERLIRLCGESCRDGYQRAYSACSPTGKTPVHQCNA